jgi:hypothetical protein
MQVRRVFAGISHSALAVEVGLCSLSGRVLIVQRRSARLYRSLQALRYMAVGGS